MCDDASVRDSCDCFRDACSENVQQRDKLIGVCAAFLVAIFLFFGVLGGVFRRKLATAHGFSLEYDGWHQDPDKNGVRSCILHTVPCTHSCALCQEARMVQEAKRSGDAAVAAAFV